MNIMPFIKFLTNLRKSFQTVIITADFSSCLILNLYTKSYTCLIVNTIVPQRLTLLVDDD